MEANKDKSSYLYMFFIRSLKVIKKHNNRICQLIWTFQNEGKKWEVISDSFLVYREIANPRFSSFFVSLPLNKLNPAANPHIIDISLISSETIIGQGTINLANLNSSETFNRIKLDLCAQSTSSREAVLSLYYASQRRWIQNIKSKEFIFVNQKPHFTDSKQDIQSNYLLMATKEELCRSHAPKTKMRESGVTSRNTSKTAKEKAAHNKLKQKMSSKSITREKQICAKGKNYNIREISRAMINSNGQMTTKPVLIPQKVAKSYANEHNYLEHQKSEPGDHNGQNKNHKKINYREQKLISKTSQTKMKSLFNKLREKPKAYTFYCWKAISNSCEHKPSDPSSPIKISANELENFKTSSYDNRGTQTNIAIDELENIQGTNHRNKSTPMTLSMKKRESLKPTRHDNSTVEKPYSNKDSEDEKQYGTISEYMLLDGAARETKNLNTKSEEIKTIMNKLNDRMLDEISTPVLEKISLCPNELKNMKSNNLICNDSRQLESFRVRQGSKKMDSQDHSSLDSKNVDEGNSHHNTIVERCEEIPGSESNPRLSKFSKAQCPNLNWEEIKTLPQMSSNTFQSDVFSNSTRNNRRRPNHPAYINGIEKSKYIEDLRDINKVFEENEEKLVETGGNKDTNSENIQLIQNISDKKLFTTPIYTNSDRSENSQSFFDNQDYKFERNIDHQGTNQDRNPMVSNLNDDIDQCPKNQVSNFEKNDHSVNLRPNDQEFLLSEWSHSPNDRYDKDRRNNQNNYNDQMKRFESNHSSSNQSDSIRESNSKNESFDDTLKNSFNFLVSCLNDTYPTVDPVIDFMTAGKNLDSEKNYKFSRARYSIDKRIIAEVMKKLNAKDNQVLLRIFKNYGTVQEFFTTLSLNVLKCTENLSKCLGQDWKLRSQISWEHFFEDIIISLDLLCNLCASGKLSHKEKYPHKENVISLESLNHMRLKCLKYLLDGL